MANILVVEDDEQVRVLAVSIVEELGHTAQSAANMDEALALLATDQVFELLFTDLGLSGHDQAGLALAVEAVRQREKLPVLYTTGQAVTDGMKALFVDSASLLPKPYTFDQLAAALTEVFERLNSTNYWSGYCFRRPKISHREPALRHLKRDNHAFFKPVA